MRNDIKFLVIGASGLVGKAVVKEISRDFDWVGTSWPGQSPLMALDLNCSENIKEIFEKIKPTHVIYCANLKGGVNFCEKNPDLAENFHFKGTIKIAKECLKHKSKFIFISSECVFDGKKESYSEDDIMQPLNIYGKYKAEAEKWIQDNLKDYAIVRTMSVYGWDPKTLTPNAVMSLYFSIANGRMVSVPTFRWGNPTYVCDLACSLIEICLSEEKGLFHVVGASFISRYEWLKKTAKSLGWDSSLILPLNEIPKNMVFRPSKISLDTKKFRAKFKTKLNTLDEALELFKTDIQCDMVNNA